jgi:hypothetical protein
MNRLSIVYYERVFKVNIMTVALAKLCIYHTAYKFFISLADIPAKPSGPAAWVLKGKVVSAITLDVVATASCVAPIISMHYD